MWLVQCGGGGLMNYPHLTEVRGVECPVIPPVHWKGVALPRQRSSRTMKTLSNCKGFYSVLSAVE